MRTVGKIRQPTMRRITAVGTTTQQASHWRWWQTGVVLARGGVVYERASEEIARRIGSRIVRCYLL